MTDGFYAAVTMNSNFDNTTGYIIYVDAFGSSITADGRLNGVKVNYPNAYAYIQKAFAIITNYSIEFKVKTDLVIHNLAAWCRYYGNGVTVYDIGVILSADKLLYIKTGDIWFKAFDIVHQNGIDCIVRVTMDNANHTEKIYIDGQLWATVTNPILVNNGSAINIGVFPIGTEASTCLFDYLMIAPGIYPPLPGEISKAVI